MQHNIWPRKIYSANLIVPRHITASKWPTNNQLNSLHSTLQVEHLRTEDWHKDLDSLSAILSFIREYLDTVIKADQCAQYVDDIGIAANTPEQLIKNLRAVFQCLRKAWLKLSMTKCHFGVQEVDFLGRTISTKGLPLKNNRLPKSSEKSNFHDPKKHFNDTLDS